MHSKVGLRPLAVTTLLLIQLVTVHLSCASLSLAYQKITKEELKELLNSDKVVILDVRETKDWQSSDYKIENAVRIDPHSTKLADLPFSKDITLVLY